MNINWTALISLCEEVFGDIASETVFVNKHTKSGYTNIPSELKADYLLCYYRRIKGEQLLYQICDIFNFDYEVFSAVMKSVIRHQRKHIETVIQIERLPKSSKETLVKLISR